MSHFTVTVIVPPETEDIREYLNKVLERYDENRAVEPYIDSDGAKTTYNPESKWDWWSIGGRWRGAYLPKPDADRDRLIYGESGAFRNDAKTFTGKDGKTYARPDGGPVGMLDLEAMRAEKREQAEKDWNQYAQVILGTPEALPWSHFYERFEGARGAMPKSRVQAVYDAENEVNERYGMPKSIPFDEIPPELNYGPGGEGDGPYWTGWQEAREKLAEDPERAKAWEAEKSAAGEKAGKEWDAALSYSIDQAREDYGNQERVKVTREAECYKNWFDSPVDVFDHLTRDEYVQQQSDRAVPGYATITIDGEWVAPGKMGWFGMSSDDETSYEVYARRVNKMIDELSPDTILVQLDCHI